MVIFKKLATLKELKFPGLVVRMKFLVKKCIYFLYVASFCSKLFERCFTSFQFSESCEKYPP